MAADDTEPNERHDRTVRLLEAKLEALAAATERHLCSARPHEGEALALETATHHAVALRVVSAGEAVAIWCAVAERHPTVRWCRAGAADLAA
jgi:hypothetical protein